MVIFNSYVKLPEGTGFCFWSCESPGSSSCEVVKNVEILHDLPTAPEPGLTCSDFEKDELRLECQIFLVCS